MLQREWTNVTTRTFSVRIFVFYFFESRCGFNAPQEKKQLWLCYGRQLDEWMETLNDSATMCTHSSQWNLSDLDLLCFHTFFNNNLLIYSSLSCSIDSSNYIINLHQQHSVFVANICPLVVFHVIFHISVTIKCFPVCCCAFMSKYGADGAVN